MQRFELVGARADMQDIGMWSNGTDTKWCHVALAAQRGRKIFKIAGTARICERAVRAVCAQRGWTVEVIAVRPDTIQTLVAVPSTLPHPTVAATLADALRSALRRAHVVPRWRRRVFGEPGWCAVLTNAAALGALRRHLARTAPEGHGAPTDAEGP
ncbi:MAG TPA: hypothetical protein VJ992_06695 [Gemmatimonadales bacterium]|nr:hypothetical protein [Gemmatimonadales bacterium]